MAKQTQPKGRTSADLRDILFNEIEQLQTDDANPQKSMAVANLAKQIINVAKVEMEFHAKTQDLQNNSQPLVLGGMQLGSAASAARNVTAR